MVTKDESKTLLETLYDGVSVTVCKKHKYVTFDHTNLFHQDDSNSLLFSKVFCTVIQHTNIAFQERPVLNTNGFMYGRFLDRFYLCKENDSAYNMKVFTELKSVLERLKRRYMYDEREQTVVQFLVECLPYITSESVEYGLLERGSKMNKDLPK